jgi:NAD-specific glutamate dehydrogenase
MRHRTESSVPQGDWTYRETIDEASSAIRVHGRVDRLGADLLRGTIETLERRGHRDITVTIDHSAGVDSVAREVLAAVAGHLARSHGRLRIAWAESGSDSEEQTAP